MTTNNMPGESVLHRCGSDFSPEEIAQTVRTGGLLTLELELSRACNLRCIYCYATAGEKNENELTLAEVFNAVDQARELGARKIIVLGGGEPLCYPDIRRVIDYLAEKELQIELFTNGVLLDASMAEFLYQRRVEVVVKLNSWRPEVQDLLADVPGTAAAIKRAIDNLQAVGYPDGQHVMGIGTIVCRQNIAELPEIWRWARKENILPYVETITVQGRAEDSPELLVSPEESGRLFKELARIDAEEFGLNWEPKPPLAGSTCSRHLYSCTVTTQGDIFPCVGVDLSCGNLREKSLKEILHQSPVFKSLRNIHNEIKGACRSCLHNGDCYGCRGNAYHLTGDYLQSDPHCWLLKSEAEERP
jgi:radical SAM protein with 4Fe4S-binding SPASM domain